MQNNRRQERNFSFQEPDEQRKETPMTPSSAPEVPKLQAVESPQRLTSVDAYRGFNMCM